MKISRTMSGLIHFRALNTSAARNIYYFTRYNYMQMDSMRATINSGQLCSPIVGFEEESKERGFVWKMKDQKTGIQLPDGIQQMTVQVMTVKGEIITASDLQKLTSAICSWFVQKVVCVLQKFGMGSYLTKID